MSELKARSHTYTQCHRDNHNKKGYCFIKLKSSQKYTHFQLVQLWFLAQRTRTPSTRALMIIITQKSLVVSSKHIKSPSKSKSRFHTRNGAVHKSRYNLKKNLITQKIYWMECKSFKFEGCFLFCVAYCMNSPFTHKIMWLI